MLKPSSPLQERDSLGKHQNMTDMDNFAATLSQIVHADVTQQALQSPLELGGQTTPSLFKIRMAFGQGVAS